MMTLLHLQIITAVLSGKSSQTQRQGSGWEYRKTALQKGLFKDDGIEIQRSWSVEHWDNETYWCVNELESILETGKMKSIMPKWKDRLPNLPVYTEISGVRIILTLKTLVKMTSNNRTNRNVGKNMDRIMKLLSKLRFLRYAWNIQKWLQANILWW